METDARRSQCESGWSLRPSSSCGEAEGSARHDRHRLSHSTPTLATSKPDPPESQWKTITERRGAAPLRSDSDPTASNIHRPHHSTSSCILRICISFHS